MRSARLALLPVLLPALALAQNFNFEGLDLAKPAKEKKEPPPEPPPGPPPELDHAEGDPVLVLPPRREGKLDLELYRVLFAALAERMGGRLVPLEATLKAVEKEKLAARLAQPDAQRKLSLQLKADLVVHLEGGPGKVEARLHPGPGERPVAEVSVPLARGRRLGLGPARALVAELLARGASTLQAPPALDLSAGAPPEAAPEPTPAAAEEPEDVARVASGVKEEVPQGPLTPAGLLVYLGGGAGFRSLESGAGLVQQPAVPVSPGAMASLAVDLQVYPLRWVKSLAGGPLADLWAEGAYRFNLVQASVATGGGTQTCRATDDEVLGRVGYRYPLPGWLPRIGVSVGVASERTTFDCAAPALNTSYGATELQLKLLEPLLGENLAVELGGGPRFLFSTRARGFDTVAFSAEGWVTARLGRRFTGRAGARVTGTRLTTYPEGVSLFDLRTFVGLEVGAAL